MSDDRTAVDRSSRHARQLEKLREIRARGPRRFILWRGVVGWGVSTAVVYSLLMTWIEADRTFLDQLPQALVVFPLAGLLWGAAMWSWHERRWRKLTAET